MNTETQLPSYQEGLRTLQEQLQTMLPKEALDIFDTDARTLEEQHHNILKLHVGDTAPDFSLQNAVGNTINLRELLKQGSIVLTFYRGSWCPYCNLQLNQYQQVLDQIQASDAQLVAISPQTPDESLSLKEKSALKFEVLSDNGNIVARQFTTVFKNDEAPLKAMSDLGIDFDSHYADDSKELPVPVVFIIEQDGRISFAKAMGGDYRHRVEPSELINALKD